MYPDVSRKCPSRDNYHSNGLTMMADHTPSRHEKSLGLLTTKFVSLLQEAKDGVLDLKIVSVCISVTSDLKCIERIGDTGMSMHGERANNSVEIGPLKNKCHNMFTMK